MTFRHAAAVAGALALAAASLAAAETYHLVATIPVGGDGGWDYLSVDSAAHRLYVSHATHVVVIDTRTNAVVGDIPDTPGVHGFALAPDLKRGFASNGREDKVSIVDLATLALVEKVPTGGNPDAILYEPGKKEVYAFNGRGRSATVIDAVKGTIVATIPLDAKPESGAADPKAGRVYVNLEDRNAIAVIDTTTHKVVETWSIAPADEPTGLAIDAEHHHLFTGAHSGEMLMLDTTTGTIVAKAPICRGVDATWYDSATKLAFSSCGDGVTTIASVSGSTMQVAQSLQTATGSRTMALDKATHRLYFSAAEYEPPTGGQARPTMKSGSFKVLVFEK